jgi:hypothetical protein
MGKSVKNRAGAADLSEKVHAVTKHALIEYGNFPKDLLVKILFEGADPIYQATAAMHYKLTNDELVRALGTVTDGYAKIMIERSLEIRAKIGYSGPDCVPASVYGKVT